ncbi:MAG: hypothetical protein FJW34_10750 [Acidobacteria bacterium]|nr:hypothetical protein [Acidobacteriota bacterium]
MRGAFIRLIAAIGLAAGRLGAVADDVPYRFLLVISDQWEDRASHLIERPSDFQMTAALLKTWGLPFDILRLDHQRLDRYHMLDRDGRPLHGTILWNTGTTPLGDQDLGLLRELVARGVGLIVLGDSVAAPEIGALAGVRYVSPYRSHEGLVFSGEHFITRGFRGREKEITAGAGYSLAGVKVAAEQASVLATRATLPFLAVRTTSEGGKVVWLGLERSVGQLANQLVRDLLKRCLVWAQGYALYAEYPRSVVLFLDDMGASDKTMLPYWHYRTLSEEEIRTGLIEPLKRRNGQVDINVVTGYVDRGTRSVLSPWRQRTPDAIDANVVHDFASTKRGLDAGVREGVFQIESHGWTHMLPDLDSPPGPWWDAPMDGVGSLDWYNEFGDRLRQREIPAATQKLHLRRSIECIREDFGVTPLVIRPGGGLYSRSYANSTARIAAQAGFGLATWGFAVYLSADLVLSLEGVSNRGGWEYTRSLTAADIPWSVDAPYWLGFHDRDVAMDRACVERLLTSLGQGVRYMSGSEYAAYLHAQVARLPERGLALAVDYDEHYCRYFATRPSAWTLHLSDELRRALGVEAPEKRVITVPKGLGRHVVRVGGK